MLQCANKYANTSTEVLLVTKWAKKIDIRLMEMINLSVKFQVSDQKTEMHF